MICRKVLNQKIIAHQATTGHGRAMNIQFLIQEMSAEAQCPGPIQGRNQIPAIPIAQDHIIPLPGRTIVFRNLSNRKPIQVPEGQAEVFQAPCVLHPVILHLQGLREVFRPGHLEVVQVAVQVVAGHQVALQEEAEEVVKPIHSDIYFI